MTWYRRAGVTLLAVPVVLAAGGCSRGIAGTPVAAPGAALLTTTCREYTGMTPPGRREVIAAIAENGNKLVATNPDLWVGVASALCTFAAPSTPVRDVVTGGLR
ncbi:MAG: hypothetical protein ACKVP6_00310 [Mycobacterium sp.]